MKCYKFREVKKLKTIYIKNFSKVLCDYNDLYEHGKMYNIGNDLYNFMPYNNLCVKFKIKENSNLINYIVFDKIDNEIFANYYIYDSSEYSFNHKELVKILPISNKISMEHNLIPENRNTLEKLIKYTKCVIKYLVYLNCNKLRDKNIKMLNINFKQEHIVRGHLRHLKNGKTIWINPYIRK